MAATAEATLRVAQIHRRSVTIELSPSDRTPQQVVLGRNDTLTVTIPVIGRIAEATIVRVTEAPGACIHCGRGEHDG